MRVYHGSDTAVSVIDLQKCKPNRDFGRGFYVTKFRSQAESMANRVAKYSKKTPVITEYEFDEYAYQDEDLNVLRFEGYNEEWLDFVVLNRNAGKRMQAHEYDIVEGNVADDKITRNITKYLKGKISKQDFLEMLKYSKPSHQLCFCTVNSLQMLDFIENPTDIFFEISEIGEHLLEALMLDRKINETLAADLFFNSGTFAQLENETALLYLKPWQEIYEMLKKELKM
ncbi:MAG: DUF3990 domain-containing protein [Prevotellaceae bacterium]|jgi:hypothetical protein|nr:DUF3990 domain-containing protein [Prevotellaceae bacterium]